ncbi:unnamed protein product [Kuraishia capsulata CBS 1993]|uniref:Altered inheritance of mitochondria protein 9, mitochondrial n=1 Tax=Kuraishia capsulata CBS 1993 TaxID=1382522 RepID=W6MGK9_9ASCO|nr:uncharacterized protein KUCA_T00000634001 [Kuraishia capsulata CBS 1993]CDK24668.1 unnamed protein product [Kuraishia capsulata CBS 1993]
MSLARISRARILRTGSRGLPVRVAVPVISARLNSGLSSEPSKHTTVLSKNFTDPARNSFFEYTWGTWLTNDAEEKLKRRTTFSIEGLNDLLRELYTKSHGEYAKSTEIQSDKTVTKKASSCESLDFLKFPNINVLTHNVSVAHLGSLNPNEDLNTKEISSIHEGKHHRIYKVVTNSDREFVLRLPYRGLYAAHEQSELGLKRKIQSEVATIDLVSERISTSKVLAYATDSNNCVESPFILMEFTKGTSLIREWNPLSENQMEVKSVIDQVMELNDAGALSIEGFQGFGSVYFKHDCPEGIPAFKEESPYVIGPIAESDSYLGATESPVGPWKLDEPLKIVEDYSSNLMEAFKDNERALGVYSKLNKLAPVLFNPDSKILPNFKELFSPRLFIPDLDPINVLKSEDSISLLDLEQSSIKPFILHSYPKFVAYDGPKIFTVEELEEIKKETHDLEMVMQYDYMFKRTRNQFLWELALNNRRKELIGAISPAVKLIKSGYVATVEDPENYLTVERSLIDLCEMWEGYAQHGLVKEAECPVKFSPSEVERNTQELQQKEQDMVKPFALTQGWIPQDLFAKLYSQKVITESNVEGNYEIDVEKAMEGMEPEGTEDK